MNIRNILLLIAVIGWIVQLFSSAKNGINTMRNKIKEKKKKKSDGEDGLDSDTIKLILAVIGIVILIIIVLIYRKNHPVDRLEVIEALVILLSIYVFFTLKDKQ